MFNCKRKITIMKLIRCYPSAGINIIFEKLLMLKISFKEKGIFISKNKSAVERPW